MIHVHTDYGPWFDGEGRRLPPYVRCWASCDLCKKAGDVVYGDTEFDKGIARASAGLEFVSPDPAMPKKKHSKALCQQCRTVTVEYLSERDDFGRYRFALLWWARFCWDEHGKVYAEDDAQPHVRQRGQHFFCDPRPYIEGYRGRGFTVVEVHKS